MGRDPDHPYQTFADAPGMVDSYQKLMALNLPVLAHKTFLDVGCNEGYYCGAALEAGAARVVGIDSYDIVVERARSRFPAAEFYCQTWENLPTGQFDVVLFASAMHYLAGREDMLDMLIRLRERLANAGTLIVEAGICPGDTKDVVTFSRADGDVHYCTLPAMANLFSRSNLAWRVVGESIVADGITRLVFHCRKMRHTAMFISGPSNAGKSYMAESLALYQRWRIVKLDIEYLEIFSKFNDRWGTHLSTGDIPQSLSILDDEQSRFIMDSVADCVIKRREIMTIEKAGMQDPVLIEGYLPDALLTKVSRNLTERGFRVWHATPAGTPEQREESVYINGLQYLVDRTQSIGIVSGTVLRGERIVFQISLDGHGSRSPRSLHVFSPTSGAVVSWECEAEEGWIKEYEVPVAALLDKLGCTRVANDSLLERLKELEIHVICKTNECKVSFLDRRWDDWIFAAR